jgi:xylose isomerase
VSLTEVQVALKAAGLAAGAVCIRFPEEYRLGAFTNPDRGMRDRAVALAADGCRWAADLGARELIVWSPYDGYDYHFAMDYQAAWDRTVDSFQALADACNVHDVRVSLEFKPTDEATRYSIVPSTGAALLLATHVDRANFGLTLDVGHLLMAGENPAQSAALVGGAGKLFSIQLNDAHVRLGAEDGLAFGSVGSVAALELVAWLKKVRYEGHLYYDTFPRKENPVREAEYNIRRFKVCLEKEKSTFETDKDLGNGGFHSLPS